MAILRVSFFRRSLPVLGSLRLTVVLLVFSAMLTFLATMAQTELGIWEVMSRYIRTWFVWHELPWFERPMPIFPGGWILGGLLLINLFAAHLSRFRGRWTRQVPLICIHGGIALLLVGEWVTAFFATEANLVLNVGESRGFTERPRQAELAIVDVTDAEQDMVWAVSESVLAAGETLVHPAADLRVEVVEFFQNSRVFLLPPEHVAAPADHTVAEEGLGPRLRFERADPVVTTDGRNVVSAVVTISVGGEAIGSWAVSTAVADPQEFSVGDRRFTIAMRPERTYLGYQFHLHEFVHERHPGTQIPSHFSSRLQLMNPETGEDREVRISMNQPLRYAGRTFYQASYANNDQTSILQVVRNPGWLLPYLACIVVTVGLIWQFVNRLGQSTRRRDKRVAATVSRAPVGRLDTAGWGLCGLAGLWIIIGLFPVHPDNQPDLDRFGSLPVFSEGRLKAMESMARGYLRTIHGKASVETPEGETLDARAWLLKVWAEPDEADALPVFTVFHPEVLSLLQRPESGREVLAFNDFRPYGQTIEQSVRQATEVPREERSTYEKAILQLDYVLTLYWRLRHSLHLGSPEMLGEMIEDHEQIVRPALQSPRDLEGQPSDPAVDQVLDAEVMRYSVLADFGQVRPVPYRSAQGPRGEWVTMGDAFTRGLQADALSPVASHYRDVLEAWARGDVLAFNAAVKTLHGWMGAWFPAATQRAEVEAKFNRLDLFMKGMVLYVSAFLLIALSWLTTPRLRGWALGLAVVALLAHTLGLGIRMYLQERPPVTSLYASAIFVGWIGMIFSLIVERWLKNGLGLAAGTLLGFSTLIIAHNLGGDGDTIEVMRAVLDSNFWLATHVVVITIGYASVYVAGFLAIAYLIARLLPSARVRETLKPLSGAVYGVVCFALLFSFAGTVLGGIWADQSWGRFWGWDPKENGALLIVIWMAIILHLRVGRIGNERLLMACAVFGNVVVAFSWFGVNMLGVGLHSYGFMEGAPLWLTIFSVSQLLLIGLALVPDSKTASAS